MFGVPETKKASDKEKASAPASTSISAPVAAPAFSASLSQPVAGTVVELSKVNDPVFASGAMGPGVAVVPSEGKLVAPCDAEVVMTFPTAHAIGLRAANGHEYLIHIGIDTVNLNGQHFNLKTEVGKLVRKGETLIEFDHNAIREAGYDPTVMLILTGGHSGQAPAALSFA